MTSGSTVSQLQNTGLAPQDRRRDDRRRSQQPPSPGVNGSKQRQTPAQLTTSSSHISGGATPYSAVAHANVPVASPHERYGSQFARASPMMATGAPPAVSAAHALATVAGPGHHQDGRPKSFLAKLFRPFAKNGEKKRGHLTTDP